MTKDDDDDNVYITIVCNSNNHESEYLLFFALSWTRTWKILARVPTASSWLWRITVSSRWTRCLHLWFRRLKNTLKSWSKESQVMTPLHIKKQQQNKQNKTERFLFFIFLGINPCMLFLQRMVTFSLQLHVNILIFLKLMQSFKGCARLADQSTSCCYCH